MPRSDAPPADASTPRLADLAPFSWFAPVASLGSRGVAILFILLAVAVALKSAISLVTTGYDDPTMPLAIAGFLVGTVLTILLPAALMLRDPGAYRTKPFLLTGLVVLGLVASARTFPEFRDVATWANLAGTLFVGVGLVRLRKRGPTHWWLLVLSLFAVVVLSLLGAVDVIRNISTPLVFTGTRIATSAALAFMLWPAAAAWLDRDEPRAFWTLLAIGLPAQVAFGLVALALGSPEPGLVTWLFFAAEIAITILVDVAALIAYGRFAPKTVERRA